MLKNKTKRFLTLVILGLFVASVLLIVVSSLSGSSVAASVQPVTSGNGNTIVIADFSVPVDPGSSTFMSRVVATAQGDNAAAIVIEMNTPGGSLSDMLSIISSITAANQSGIPTYTFITPNGLGASAGSYIAMATNKILMAPGSIIGPSTPYIIGGTDLEQNHTQAAMLSLLTSLAEDWGRNTTAVYGMVQSNQAFSANQAVAIHIADGSAASLSDALNQLGLSGNHQAILSEDLYEQIISALSNATLDGILFLVGIIAIVLDIYHPTIVLTILGVIAIVAGMVGAEIIGASLLGIVILVIAAALIVAELKLGHGFALIAGVVLGAFGIYYLSLGLQYSPSPITALTEIELGILVVFGVIIGLYIRWIIGPVRRRSKLTGPEAMMGKIGIAITDLKPNGDVRVQGEIWRAKSISGDVEKGDQVIIKALNGLVVIVEKVQEQKSQTQNDSLIHENEK
ncbi:MAG TPA: NfeD family protein [Candidatus Acidoferrum sp.]|nr:NfeD family protein [Candidatus Acidoferrum sp.]